MLAFSFASGPRPRDPKHQTAPGRFDAGLFNSLAVPGRMRRSARKKAGAPLSEPHHLNRDIRMARDPRRIGTHHPIRQIGFMGADDDQVRI